MISKTSEEPKANQLLGHFNRTTMALEHVYDVTIYGQKHHEVKNLQILEKLGANINNPLTRKELRQAVDEVNAINKGDKMITLELTNKQAALMRKVMRGQLHAVKRIPRLARTQLLVALAGSFEGYVADIIRLIFNTNPNTLKTGKSTLNDEELVEALASGATLQVLIEHRVRNIMYGTAKEWFTFLNKDVGFKLETTPRLEELFLIRNCILHNNGNVSRELRDSQNRRYRNVAKPINVTERDIYSYLDTARNDARTICEEFSRKFYISDL